MSKIQKPKIKESQHIKLGPEEDRNTNGQIPHFSFEFIQADDCIKSCEKNDQAQLAAKLQELSSLTWNELIAAPRHGQGLELINKKCIKRPIPDKFKDEEKFVCLRFSGKKPILGVRKGRVLHIIWVDKNSDVYPHS